ncbi:MAG: class I SAM-dependent methyltransferase [Lamprocystis purpurea]|jgi:SAM-dependent methyltransferase|uniref:class I SAM-dependent methyltransferase n=1 Tax=Lamprocystis purpurea TaxID=61598 RepID=UPI000367DDED|nr:class I SAM-dependent methyltransferase [Lamprocystis purpurea]MBV5273652.1 class I SAM-dependent methyltransferase [Lamprocystis purpurea]
MDDDTTAYYRANADTFFADTLAVDMAPLYARFLPHLPVGGRILDAGCGSGRDALAFRERGYAVTAFDASAELAALAAAHLGQPVQVLRFQDLERTQAFDGIWACASLLHVPGAELPEVLRRLAMALRPGGVLYASFKYGSGEREHHGRRFTDLDEAGLATLLTQVQGLTELETWTTGDRRPGRESERWLNALLTTTADAWPNS